MKNMMRISLLLALASLVLPQPAQSGESKDREPAVAAEVSYYKQVRPIFQAQCQGCHQPAKAGGGYVMTSFAKLIAGGDSKDAAVVPKSPAESHLIEQITPIGGRAEIPKDKPPLNTAEIEPIREWIAQGAVDDTPDTARVRYDKDHPPVYSRPPVITAIDFSPDGPCSPSVGSTRSCYGRPTVRSSSLA